MAGTKDELKDWADVALTQGHLTWLHQLESRIKEEITLTESKLQKAGVSLPGAGLMSMTEEYMNKKPVKQKRTISEEGRRRMIIAQKKRWAAFKKKKAAEDLVKTKGAAPSKKTTVKKAAVKKTRAVAALTMPIDLADITATE